MDSGADISVLSLGCLDKSKISTNGVVAGIGGKQSVGEAITYKLRFLCSTEKGYEVALKHVNLQTDMIILGRDFLSKFGATTFDWKNHRIQLGDEEGWIYLTQEASQKTPQIWNINKDLSREEQDHIHTVLKQFPNVFAHDPKAPRESMKTKHVIESKDDRICFSKVRRIPNKWKESVNSQVDEMIKNDIIRPSKSPFNSNPVLVDKKSDSSKRFAVDFRNLNKNTVPDSCPLPNVDDLLDQCHGAKYFSQLDLASGYWGIPINEKDKFKTAFSVPRGKFEFNRMPFGLVNAQATFQRCMDSVVEEVKQRGGRGIDAYVDNIILFSVSFEDHIKTLQILLKVLDEHGFSLRVDKCEFGYPYMEFLGFILDGKSIRPSPENIEKIKNFPSPKNRKALRRFLGLVNFNRRFVRNIADKCAPLNKLTSDKVTFKWTEHHQKSFESIRAALTAELSLHIPDWSKDFVIMTDASDSAVGSVLGQWEEGGLFKPLGYHSETLVQAARNSWSATERELFGIISASRKWKPYCCGKIEFLTDHLPLKTIRNQKDPRGKIGRWILELENLDYKISYIKGKYNVEADCLSRITVMETSDKLEPPLVYHIAAEELPSLLQQRQKDDPAIRAVIDCIKSGDKVTKGPFRNYTNISLQDGLLCKGGRIVVPDSLAEDLLCQIYKYRYITK